MSDTGTSVVSVVVPTPAPTPTASSHATLGYILGALDMMAQMAEFIPQASRAASWADSLLQIATKTQAAHEALFGKPLDYSNLKPYTSQP